MDEKILERLETGIRENIDEAVEKNLDKALGSMVTAEVKNIVQQMRLDRATTGEDITGLTLDEKKGFAETLKAVSGYTSKANEALIGEQDNRGGYLVPVEVASGIERIAASVGLGFSLAKQWQMSTDELDVPAYTGSFLEGEYLGVDAAGSVTALTFQTTRLVAKKWQLAFVVGNDLLADANVDLVDWIVALAGEALANRADKEIFAGTGAPFTGILNHDDVTVHTMATGNDTFAEFDMDEASDVIATLEESMQSGAAFFFHRTVWAQLKKAQDGNGRYIFGTSNAGFADLEKPNTALRPQGVIQGYPVYTVRHLPANSATAVSTNFGIFGNLQGAAYGRKPGTDRIAQHTSGSFGGKEVALADQRGLVIGNRHAFGIVLPAAFTVIKTAAS